MSERLDIMTTTFDIASALLDFASTSARNADRDAEKLQQDTSSAATSSSASSDTSSGNSSGTASPTEETKGGRLSDINPNTSAEMTACMTTKRCSGSGGGDTVGKPEDERGGGEGDGGESVPILRTRSSVDVLSAKELEQGLLQAGGSFREGDDAGRPIGDGDVCTPSCPPTAGSLIKQESVQRTKAGSMDAHAPMRGRGDENDAGAGAGAGAAGGAAVVKIEPELTKR